MKVFISHNSADKKFVRTLKTDLNENGIDTFVDEDSLEFGDSLKERLEEGIKESSHFIIILTPNSIKSSWVKDELKEALALFDKKTIAKIIPIKYRECEIPEPLEKLLYANLSQEIVQVEKEKIAFLTDGYAKFLPKLITTLQSSEKRLNKNDITNLMTDTKASDNVRKKKPNDEFITNHKVIGFKDNNVLLTFRRKIIDNNNKFKSTIGLFPIVLPTFYKAIFLDIEYGDEIKFTLDGKSFVIGHFAGYRTTADSGIGIPGNLRKFLKVDHGKVYSFSINPDKKIFQRL
jgi:hypothetical protein